MTAAWQVQEAKNRFSEVIDKALAEGPQVVTRHGRPVVQIVAMPGAAADRHVRLNDGFAAFLLSAPRIGDLEPPPRRSRTAPPDLGE
ncbi:MAG: type II toxin-antitoxin system prevent-host-death family antitoxin [Burkholderiaceae bacterium]